MSSYFTKHKKRKKNLNILQLRKHFLPLELNNTFSYFCFTFFLHNFKHILYIAAPGCLSQLIIQLWLRSWSHGVWVWAPSGALWWQLRPGVCFEFCVSLSLCPSPSHALSLFSQVWINVKIFKKILYVEFEVLFKTNMLF